jgi:hypothetical protein
MGVFGRKRRVDLGTYVEPEPEEHAPVAQVVAEGALIGESVVRLAVRNRVIVDALRERKDVDRVALAGFAARELETLSRHERESADRVQSRRERQIAADAGRKRSALDPDDIAESRRREDLHRRMADAFADRSADAGRLADIVERSLHDAWTEIGPVFIERAGERSLVIDRDPQYEQERVDRVGALLAVDLASLAQQRGVEL